MIEIKFRAYHEYMKKMLIPIKLHLNNWKITCFETLLDDNVYQVKIDDKEYWLHIMQYTWLKDRNWKEVYEWDILRMDSEHDENNRIDIAMKERWTEFYHCEVLYHDDYLFNNVKVFDRGEEIDSTWWDQTFLRYLCKRWYVVGNIYEDKHLLNN